MLGKYAPDYVQMLWLSIRLYPLGSVTERALKGIVRLKFQNWQSAQEGFLKTVFNFTGVEQVDVVRAEGVNMGEELKNKAIEAALAQVKLI